MGEVYRARDTRLERIVALKILRAQLSSDPARKQRFEREAKTISSLNHPHICTLHDIGSQDGVDYLVMECVEGETLAKRLEKGPLPLKQVLKYGAQIADALDKAHRAGIVHRDLKPGNIMLTAAGAKLLDFGLAKPAAPLTSVTSPTTVVTQDSPVTERGTIAGTFQYMSPEQVEGKELDERSDIFSLGSVLYETLTGQKAFGGKSQMSVASAILEKEPAPISTMKPLTPPALDHAIRRCLTKEVEKRWQNAGDLARELEWAAESEAQAGQSAPISARSKTKERLAWTFALATAFLAAGLAFVHFNKRSPQTPVLRTTILPPEGGTFVFNGPIGGAFLSPDGHAVAFVARVGEVTQLWIRPLDSFGARALPGTDDASFAFWSPDGRNLGFFAQGKLKRIAVAGGPPQTLCNADAANRGASWSREDVIIFARVSGEIQSIPASGGTPQRVTLLDKGRHEGTHRWPFFLPDGNHFLFMAAKLGSVSEDNVFYLGSLDGKPSRILFHGSSPIVFSAGQVLYLAENVLMARPFDPVKLNLTGEAVSVADGVQTDPLFSNGVFSASQNEMLLYQAGRGPSAHSVVILDRAGKPMRGPGDAFPGTSPRFSPDAKNVAYDLVLPGGGGRIELWVANIISGGRSRLASDPLSLVTHSVVWSPNGTHLAYSCAKSSDPSICIRAIGQIAQEEERWEAKGEAVARATDWTPDGKSLIISEGSFRTEGSLRTLRARVLLLPVEGNEDAAALLEVQGADVDSGQVSPDSRWIAYSSDESGKNEIYISPFPKPVGKLQVSSAGGLAPRWRGDAKELYYLAPDKKLMAVELQEVGGSLQVRSIRPLFEMSQTLVAYAANQYDVSRDGSRFVVDSLDADQTSAPLNLVVNWTAEMKTK